MNEGRFSRGIHAGGKRFAKRTQTFTLLWWWLIWPDFYRQYKSLLEICTHTKPCWWHLARLFTPLKIHLEILPSYINSGGDSFPSGFFTVCYYRPLFSDAWDCISVSPGLGVPIPRFPLLHISRGFTGKNHKYHNALH